MFESVIVSRLSQQLILQRGIHLSRPLFAEPLRKKKQVSPLVTKKQYERKIRRLEREINKLESIPLKLKPILELQLSPQILKELDARTRKEKDEDAKRLLDSFYDAWCVYKFAESVTEMKSIVSVRNAQKRALNALKSYPDLYEQAIQVDPELIPFKVDNIKKHTPPIENYNCPDGNEFDITKEWKL